MRRSFLVVAFLGCGSTTARTPHRMTAREIVDASSPAVVVIQAGDDRVGTGFIVDPAGLIATNLHVIEGETTIKVQLYKDQAALPVMSIAGVDRVHDLALVWIKAPRKLTAVHLGDSNVMSAGDQVYAIGNPENFTYSVSDGLVAQVREVNSDLTLLQISAPISLGSSGGPLFNQFGEVIGVTTLIVKDGQNLNFAMPANYLRPMIKQPQTIALADFAQATQDLAARDEGATGSGDEDDNIEIRRVVPVHAVGVLDGCSQKDIEDVVTSIAQAIEVGAPLYNQKTKQGFEACYRVYEGTGLRYEKDAACKGIRSAFGDGLLRASSLASYKEKAWAMRDTFDGLIGVAFRWAKQNHVKLQTPIDPP